MRMGTGLGFSREDRSGRNLYVVEVTYKLSLNREILVKDTLFIVLCPYPFVQIG